MKNTGILAGALALSMLGAGSASAATVNFGHGGSILTVNDLGNPVSCGVFLSGCTDFTVTAGYSGVANFTGVSVTQGNNGIGVNGAPDIQPSQVDGFPDGSTESLTFSFAQSVELTGFTLEWINTFLDGDDEYSFFFDGNLIGDMVDAATWSGSIMLDTLTILAIGGDASDDCDSCGWFGTPKYDDFRVSSISYEISVVPVPAALPLLGAGLLGLGLLSRRRKNAIV